MGGWVLSVFIKVHGLPQGDPVVGVGRHYLPGADSQPALSLVRRGVVVGGISKSGDLAISRKGLTITSQPFG